MTTIAATVILACITILLASINSKLGRIANALEDRNNRP